MIYIQTAIMLVMVMAIMLIAVSKFGAFCKLRGKHGFEVYIPYNNIGSHETNQVRIRTCKFCKREEKRIVGKTNWHHVKIPWSEIYKLEKNDENCNRV